MLHFRLHVQEIEEERRALKEAKQAEKDQKQAEREQKQAEKEMKQAEKEAKLAEREAEKEAKRLEKEKKVRPIMHANTDRIWNAWKRNWQKKHKSLQRRKRMHLKKVFRASFQWFVRKKRHLRSLSLVSVSLTMRI